MGGWDRAFATGPVPTMGNCVGDAGVMQGGTLAQVQQGAGCLNLATEASLNPAIWHCTIHVQTGEGEQNRLFGGLLARFKLLQRGAGAPG